MSPSDAELVELRRFRDELYELVRQRLAVPWPSIVDGVQLGVQREAKSVRLIGAGGRVKRVVGDVLGFVLEARLDGTLHRLLACDHCHWSYYDRSRNAGGHWALDGHVRPTREDAPLRRPTWGQRRLTEANADVRGRGEGRRRCSPRGPATRPR